MTGLIQQEDNGSMDGRRIGRSQQSGRVSEMTQGEAGDVNR